MNILVGSDCHAGLCYVASSMEGSQVKMKIDLRLYLFPECINSAEEQKALTLFKDYIFWEFKDKLESIQTDKKYIHIMWKA